MPRHRIVGQGFPSCYICSRFASSHLTSDSSISTWNQRGIGLNVELAPATLVVTVVLGVLAVALGPVFTVRRMQRMDLPGTLRAME